MTTPHSDPAVHVSWLRDWWHVIAGLITGVAILWRRAVAGPVARLAAVERTAAGTAETVTALRAEVRDEVAEVRVGMARMSDAHAEALHELSARIDRVLELVAGSPHCHRRHFDPNDEEG